MANYGLSKEGKARIIAANKGKVVSAETRLKQSVAGHKRHHVAKAKIKQGCLWCAAAVKDSAE